MALSAQNYYHVDPMTDIKPIAFYLPQFYETPYNNEWWGEGYTEWVGARGATPLFDGHYQPQLPAKNDGYLYCYDQTELATLLAQVELAKRYGVHGFCHYYYWFDGKRVLEKPTELMLANPSIDMPFCLCWANENWSRRWDGQESHVLIAQDYSPESYDRFAADLSPYFSDPRYITAGRKALFLIYRPDEIPDLPRLVSAIKKQAKICGHDDALVVGAETFVTPGLQSDPRKVGLDGAVEFPPHGVSARMYYLRDDAAQKHIEPSKRTPAADFDGRVFDAFEAYANALERPVPDYPLFRSCFPAWDNTARRGASATVFAGSSPALFKHWVGALSDWTRANGQPDAPFIFVNAWNEWAEGAHLEPDHIYGFEYLEALRDGISPTPSLEFPFDWGDSSIKALWQYREGARPKLGCTAGLADVAARMEKHGLSPETTPPFWADVTDLTYLSDPAHMPKTRLFPDMTEAREAVKDMRNAGTWHDVKTALWRRYNHPHPKTPWQKFTTGIFRNVLGKK